MIFGQKIEKNNNMGNEFLGINTHEYMKKKFLQVAEASHSVHRDHPKIFFQGGSNFKIFYKSWIFNLYFWNFFHPWGVKTPPDPPWDDP